MAGLKVIALALVLILSSAQSFPNTAYFNRIQAIVREINLYRTDGERILDHFDDFLDVHYSDNDYDYPTGDGEGISN